MPWSGNASRFAVNLMAGGLVMFWAALAVGYSAASPATPAQIAPWLRMLVAVWVAALALFAVPPLVVLAVSRRRLFGQPAAAPGAAGWGRLIGLVAMLHWCLLHTG